MRKYIIKIYKRDLTRIDSEFLTDTPETLYFHVWSEFCKTPENVAVFALNTHNKLIFSVKITTNKDTW